MFMDHTYTQTDIDNYKLQVELLEEKLKRSEEHRHHLEHKLGQILKKRSEHEKAMRLKAQEKYQQFAEEQEKRNKRNKELLQMLERIDEQSAILSARSERLKMMKLQHEMYFSKLFKAHTMSCMQGDVTTTTPSVPVPVIRGTDLQTVKGDEAAPISTPFQPSTVSLSPPSPTITTDATSTTPLVNKALRNPLSGYQNLEISDHVTAKDSFGSLSKGYDCNTGGTVVENFMTVAQLASPYWTFALAMPKPTGSLFTSAPSVPLSTQTQTAADAQQSTALAESAQTTKLFRNLDGHQYQSQGPVENYVPIFPSKDANNSLAQINVEKFGTRAEEQNAMKERLLPTNTAFEAFGFLSKHRGIQKGKDSNENIRIKDEHNVNLNDNTVVYNETNNNNYHNNKIGVPNNNGLISPMPSEKRDDIRDINTLRNRQMPISDNKEICNRGDNSNNGFNNNNNNTIIDDSNNNNNDYVENEGDEGCRNVNLNEFRKCAISRQVTNIATTPSLFKTTSASPLTQSSAPSTRIPSSLTFNKLRIPDENVKVFQQKSANEYKGDTDVTNTTTITTTKLTNTCSSEEIVEPTQTADSRSNNTRIKEKKIS